MIPAFTSRRCLNSYLSNPKQFAKGAGPGGTTYINPEMEKELFSFQQQIEKKFKHSKVN